MNYDTFASIDPGFGGALAIIKGDDIELYDTPINKVKKSGKMRSVYDIEAMAILIDSTVPCNTMYAIELAQAMPGQGVSSMFKIGYGAGLWHGLLTMSGQEYKIVTPTVWKRYFDLLKQDKQASIDKALELYPDADIHLKKHNGRAEALLMAHWLKETQASNH